MGDTGLGGLGSQMVLAYPELRSFLIPSGNPIFSSGGSGMESLALQFGAAPSAGYFQGVVIAV